jgi:hypothetical protein
MTEQKIVVVDGRKFEAVPSTGCDGCTARNKDEGGLHGSLCLALPSCSSSGTDDGVIFVELKDEQKSPTTEDPVKQGLVVLHGIVSVSNEANDLLAQGYKILSMSADLTSVAFVLGEGVVHPQFSVKE